MSDDRIKSGDPYDDYPRRYDDRDDDDFDREDTVVVCPQCYQVTDSLKFYELPYFLFLFAFFVWGSTPKVACPSCMRSSIFVRMLGFIPLANIAYPILAIAYVVQLIRTFSPGHSDFLLAASNRMSRDEQFSLQHTAIPPQRQTQILLYVLLGLIAFVLLSCVGLSIIEP